MCACVRLAAGSIDIVRVCVCVCVGCIVFAIAITQCKYNTHSHWTKQNKIAQLNYINSWLLPFLLLFICLSLSLRCGWAMSCHVCVCSLICVNKLQLEDTEPRNRCNIFGHTRRIIRAVTGYTKLKCCVYVACFFYGKCWGLSLCWRDALRHQRRQRERNCITIHKHNYSRHTYKYVRETPSNAIPKPA